MIFLFLFLSASLFGQNSLPPWFASEDAQAHGTLIQAAQSHALELLERGEISHQGRDGKKVGDRLFDLGFTSGIAGEVIGAGPDIQSIWQGWWDSPGHREILLETDWLYYGIGELEYSGGILVVITFFKKN